MDRYALYLEQEAYKTHFGFTARPSVLFITTRADTTALIDLFPEKWSKRFYATTITHKPLPTANLFVPWQGKHGTLDLAGILERKADGQSREGAEGHAALAGD